MNPGLFRALTLAAATLLPLQLVAQTPAAPSPSRPPGPAKTDPNSPANAGRLQLSNYLDAIAARNLDARHTAVAAIRTRAEAEARQRKVRQQIFSLIGPLPERTPLNAKVLGTTQADGFRIEKILFDSQPGFHVTALFYVPDGPATKLPTILMAPGHSPAGKAGDFAFASTFAHNGFAVLSYDPIGQGERLQYPDPDRPNQSLATRPTGEHGEAGLQPVLLGEAVAKYFLWDAMRAIDYLTTRPEVDSTRIGAFGCSGGGMMTALTAALDPRIAVTGTACYITSFDTLLPSIGPQDGEQSIPGFLVPGPSGTALDFPDWIELTAPKPYAIISTTSDMFPFAGAQKSEAEARTFYKLWNADQNLAFITGPGGHGNLRPITPQILSFFVKHLQPQKTTTAKDSSTPIPDSSGPGVHPVDRATNPSAPSSRSFTALRWASREGATAPAQASPAPTAQASSAPTLPKDALQVTPTGQVATSYPNSETVFSLNLKHAQQLINQKTIPTNPNLTQLRQSIRAITHAASTPGAPSPTSTPNAATDPDHIRHRLKLTTEPGITVDAEFYRPLSEGKHPCLLILRDSLDPSLELQRTDDIAHLRALAQTGTAVFVLAPRPSPPGTEETKSPILGDFYLTGLRSELVGKAILGMRIDDIIRAIDFFSTGYTEDPNNITAEASGHLGVVLLHAAVLDSRLKHVTIDRPLASYDSLLKAPLPRNAPEDILPGVLLRYDIPTLIQALGPRLTLTNPTPGNQDLANPLASPTP